MLEACRNLGAAEAVWDLNLNYPDSEKFDTVIALWNVLGHVPNFKSRVEALKRMRNLLDENGQLILDLQNWHNSRYGKWRTRWRRFIDAVLPSYSRGDYYYSWQIDGKSMPAFGHLFTEKEIHHMLAEAGLKVRKLLYIDYDNGTIQSHVSRGMYYVEAIDAGVNS